MLSVLAHELEETATDPQLNAWYSANGKENGDKCAWTWGTTYSSGGGFANMKIGGTDYLIQQNFTLTSNSSNTSTQQSWSGSCAIKIKQLMKTYSKTLVGSLLAASMLFTFPFSAYASPLIKISE